MSREHVPKFLNQAPPPALEERRHNFIYDLVHRKVAQDGRVASRTPRPDFRN